MEHRIGTYILSIFHTGNYASSMSVHSNHTFDIQITLSSIYKDKGNNLHALVGYLFVIKVYIYHLGQALTNTLTTSKVAYFKRKYAEEEDLHQDYPGYFPKHLILPEDRTCILKLSLQKLQFLEDPELYLRRSVLINNLLRKIHLDTERERYEYLKESSCCRTAYSDTRKRLKFMVQECRSQSLYYKELHSYHIVPYSPENAIYGVGYSSQSKTQSTLRPQQHMM
ncbi:SERTA domain-containing protein 4, partial [Ophiophagus hannah]